MESRYRAMFINSLSGYKSVNLIGTKNDANESNLAVFSSVVHLGASPALVGFVMRPDTTERHTLANIKNEHCYTINMVDSTFWQAAHQCSASYQRDESEFEQTGLTEELLSHFQAPFVKESRLKYAVKLKEIVPITHNDTLFVIGEITDIYCDESVIQADGYIDIEKLDTVCVSGLDSYHQTDRLARLKYAKPHHPIERLP